MSNEVQEKYWSWVIAFACCFINCLLYGVSRLSGLLMVATVEAFNVTRAKAALPYSISTSVRNLSGIFVGYLGQKFGLRPVISVGCILAALGAACCFFVKDVVWISVCWGGIFGMGCGLATCLLPLAINQHFGRHRGTASGISYSGSYIGSFAFPPLLVQLLEMYGLSGTFLVISGTMLNGLAAAMLFRPSNQRTPKQPSETETKSLEFHSSVGLSSRLKSFFRKLFNHFSTRKVVMKTTELPLAHKIPSIYLIAYEPLCDWNVNKKGTLPLGTEILIGDKAVLRKKAPSGYFDHTDRINNFPMQFSYPMDENSNLKISSVKSEICPSEYRTEISKLWEIVLLHMFQKPRSFGTCAPSLSVDSVKLTSFKNLECIKPFESKVPFQSYSFKEHQHNSNGHFQNTTDVTGVLDNPEVTRNSKDKFHASLNSDKNGDKEQPKSMCLDGNSNIPVSQYDCEVVHQRSVVTGTCNDASLHQHECKHVSSHHSLFNKTTSNVLNSLRPSDNIPPNKNNLLNIQSSVIKDICKCCFGWFRMFSDPMFVVITVTMSLHTFVIVCMVTIIEDFAKDIQVPCNRVHHVLMVLSTADLIGALSLGSITDRGLISREIFMVLCLLGTGVTSIAISFSRNLITLLVLVAFYGLFETGVIITFPLLIAQFIREKKQPVALASSNVLSSPTVLFVPPLIGYFRDNIGCYSGVFYVLGVTSFISSFIWVLAPYVLKRYRTKQPTGTQLATC